MPAKGAMSGMNAEVALVGVARRYESRRGGEVVALDGLELTVRPGEGVGVVGPCGCGKLTLLELIAGLQEPDGGTVEVGGDGGTAGRLAARPPVPQPGPLV